MIIHRLIYLSIISIVLFTASYAMAQSSDDRAKSLGDILNPKVDYGNDGKPLTAAIMANHYYKTCINKKSLAFDDSEKEILCSCTAAKMSENLTIQNFMNLYKKTQEGKNARDLMLAYSYAPCMEHVIDKKVTTDCYVSNYLNDIVKGKSLVCKCAAERFKQYVSLSAARIITTAMLNEPMELDPLGYYFERHDYQVQNRVFIRQCRFEFEYNRDNKR